MRRWPLSGCILLLGLLACGPGAQEEAYQRLQRQVEAVRSSAEAGDAAVTVQRLDNLRSNVAELRGRAVITEPEAQRILLAAARVQSALVSAGGTGPPVDPPEDSAQPPAPETGGQPGASGRDGAPGQDGAPGERGQDGQPGQSGRARAPGS